MWEHRCCLSPSSRYKCFRQAKSDAIDGQWVKGKYTESGKEVRWLRVQIIVKLLYKFKYYTSKTLIRERSIDAIEIYEISKRLCCWIAWKPHLGSRSSCYSLLIIYLRKITTVRLDHLLPFSIDRGQEWFCQLFCVLASLTRERAVLWKFFRSLYASIIR